MAGLNRLDCIIMKYSAQSWKQWLSAQLLPLPFQNLGPFISWMLKLYFFTVNFFKLFICINWWVLATKSIHIMFVYWRNLFMALSRPLVPSTNNLLIFPSPLASLIANMSLYLFIEKEMAWHTFSFMLTIILIATSDVIRQYIMSLLSFEFSMKDSDALFLGLAVTHHACGLFLSQQKYDAKTIKQAGMTSCKLTITSVDTKSKLSISSGSPYKDPT